MKIKTTDLEGAALDWAVAKCEGSWILSMDSFAPNHRLRRMNFSTDWAQGGPIIERECIDLQFQGGDTDIWAADMFGAESMVYGDTPLVAAMRCYVATKLGDAVEVPEELV